MLKRRLLKQQDDARQEALSTPLPPSTHKVHSLLVLAQVFFGLGSVVGALGLPTMNPLAFALYREIAAGMILFVWAYIQQRRSTEQRVSIRKQWKRFLWLGLFIFGNQAACITGIKMAGPVAAAVWQPSQPIMMAAICMCLGYEGLSVKRILGVIIAFCGCAAMVTLSTTHATSKSPLHVLVGSCFFFINCLCSSLYVLCSKSVLSMYPPLTVTAWSYAIAAVYMALTCVTTSFYPNIAEFLCPDCIGWWHVPAGAMFAMGYFVIFVSVFSYSMITWANQHVTGTLVMGYSVLQPVTATLVTLGLLISKIYAPCNISREGACLDPPGGGAMVGMMGVFMGLFFIVSTEPIKKVVVDAAYEPVLDKDQHELGLTEIAIVE